MAFQNAVVATDIFPPRSKATVKDISNAFLTQFQRQIAPLTISAFNSEFVIELKTAEQKSTVLASRILQARDFCAVLVPWSTRYGGSVADWNTKITVDVTGFPPHAADKHTFTALLNPHCSIQTCGFHKAKGVCRVDAYALAVVSIPSNGQVAVELPTEHGIHRATFNVIIKTYPYGEAPNLDPDDSTSFADCKPKTYCSDDDVEYDSDMLREAFEAEIEAERDLYGVGRQTNNSDSDYDEEGNYLHREDSFWSIESDRSGHWN